MSRTDHRVSDTNGKSVILVTSLSLLLVFPLPARADENPPAEPLHLADLWDLLRTSGIVGLLIFCLSVALVALVIDQMLTLRRRRLFPTPLAETLRERIGQRDFDGAKQLCQQSPCYLTQVVRAGLNEVPFGYPSVEKAMEDASQRQASRLFRRVEYLALIGNLAPMLGLLGTVIGLVLAFKKVARTEGTALAAELADGIYLALTTTVMGLIVAIPALGMYQFFRGRIEYLAGEGNLLAERAFLDYKHDQSKPSHPTS